MTTSWWARLVLGRTTVSDPDPELPALDTRSDAEWRPLVKGRLVIILGVLFAWAAAVEARLVYLQVGQHEKYLAKAEGQQQDVIAPEAPRGDIYDRNGNLLAYSIESHDVFANPSILKDRSAAVAEAREICNAFADCTPADHAAILEKLTRPRTKEVLLRPAKLMTADAVHRLEKLMTDEPKGSQKVFSVHLVSRIWRYYPKMDLAAHVIGFMQADDPKVRKADGQGVAGIERKYNQTLRGVPGRVLIQKDARPEKIFERVERAPTPGLSLELTLDQRIQYAAEKALAEGIRATGALGGSAIVMDPNTGEIYAMASYPAFNPNDLGSASQDATRNNAVQSMLEPGSTYKLVTLSAALNEGVMRPSDIIDTNGGRLPVPGRAKPITEDKNHNYGSLTLEEVLIRSSNVGAVKVGWAVGAERMIDYTTRLGFGHRVSTDFVPEAAGQVTRVEQLNASALASMSMGYQINVTPLQMATAASIIANGGLTVEPHVLRAVVSQDGRRGETTMKPGRRVLSAETAATMTSFMEGVVSHKEGTGSKAALERYRVAGKTGTAKKAIKGGYSNSDYNVSFVGIVPSRKPAFTILVVVDTPREGAKYGGAVAAPIFRTIAEAALQYAGIQPSINPVPPVMVAADRSTLFSQPVRASNDAPKLTRVGGRLVMPDLHGMTLRDAMRVTNMMGMPISSEGDGFVVSQTPEAGAILDSSDRGMLQLRRLPVSTATGGGGR